VLGVEPLGEQLSFDLFNTSLKVCFHISEKCFQGMSWHLMKAHVG